MFIRDPYAGYYYIAERSPRGYHRYLWSIMPVEPTSADIRIDASRVPRAIRRQAYRMFHDDRRQGSAD